MLQRGKGEGGLKDGPAHAKRRICRRQLSRTPFADASVDLFFYLPGFSSVDGAEATFPWRKQKKDAKLGGSKKKVHWRRGEEEQTRWQCGHPCRMEEERRTGREYVIMKYFAQERRE